MACVSTAEFFPRKRASECAAVVRKAPTRGLLPEQFLPQSCRIDGTVFSIFSVAGSVLFCRVMSRQMSRQKILVLLVLPRHRATYRPIIARRNRAAPAGLKFGALPFSHRYTSTFCISHDSLASPEQPVRGVSGSIFSGPSEPKTKQPFGRPVPGKDLAHPVGADLQGKRSLSSKREAATASVIPWYYDIFVSIDCS